MKMDGKSVDVLLAQLRDPSTSLQALKHIKHRIVGHEDQRAAYVQGGLVPELVRVLDNSSEPTERQYEAAVIVGSLVYGGSSYVDSLIEAGAIGRLIATLNPQRSSPRIILSTLHTLDLLLDTCTSYTRPPGRIPPPSAVIISTIYDSNNTSVLESLKWILCQDSPAPIVQQQISLVATLISKTCDFIDYINDGEERTPAPSADVRKTMLVDAGILNVLVYRLGEFIARDIARDDISLDGRPILAKKSTKGRPSRTKPSVYGDTETFGSILEVDFLTSRPEPAYPNASLAPILEALSVITYESTSRCQLLHRAEWLREVAKLPPREEVKPPKTESHSAITQDPNSFLNAMAFPPLSAGPLPINRSFTHIPSINSSAIPTPNRQSPVPHIRRGGRGIATPASDEAWRVEDDDGYLPADSVLVPWLIARVRLGDAYSRLLSISMLTWLFRVGMVKREVVSKVYIPVIIPVLVNLIDTSFNKCNQWKKSEKALDTSNRELLEHRLILEKAPKILSRLVVENQNMTSAAYNASIIPKLGRILKNIMDTPPVKDEGAMYCSAAAGMTTANTLQKIHNLKTIEGVLKCFGTLTLYKDKYRQAIIAEKVVPCVVAAMKPLADPANPESIPVPKVSPDSQYQSEGSPRSVLIAACSLICSLSRSVSVLRTSLIDARVQDPLFTLLSYPNLEVRIVATAALCNLVLEFSPMRKAIVDAGVVKVLTEHTRSSSPQLRVEAMWALKHLIFAAERDIKSLCYNELGSSWLLKLMTEDEEGQVEEGYRDLDGDEGMADPFAEQPLGISLEDLIQEGSSYTMELTTRLSGLTSDGSSDDAPISKQKATIQEQSLDFVRNLFCGEDASRMVDKVLQDFGKDKLFEVLSSKIRPKIYAPVSPGGQCRVVYESSGEIITSVAYIIAHMAASEPKHKQMVVEQKDFCRLFLHLGELPLQGIRTGFVWALINLTCADGDGQETYDRMKRVQALKSLGYDKILEKLSKDSDLDVKERTKTVLHQMQAAMKQGVFADDAMKH